MSYPAGTLALVPFSMIAGDLFAAGLPAIGHGCNCAGAMGAGIAVQFKRRYPEMYRAYQQRCRDRRFQPGDVFVWETADVVVNNLASQPLPGPTATLDAIESSVRSALADVANRGLPALGLPRLGSGLGGLAWPDVAAVLHRLGDDGDTTPHRRHPADRWLTKLMYQGEPRTPLQPSRGRRERPTRGK